MATVSGTVEDQGLITLVSGMKDASTLTLQAWGLNVSNLVTPVLLDSKTPVFALSGTTAGEMDLNANVEFDLTSAEQATVTTVRLYSTTNLMTTVTLTTDNSFPAGGKLIVSSYEVAVTAG